MGEDFGMNEVPNEVQKAKQKGDAGVLGTRVLGPRSDASISFSDLHPQMNQLTYPFSLY